ncbi:unnamed protein product [Echinostoma caproni]|uniref:Rap-GAP domain-containing protein n=1 Tax=Echinostoma caproni TaxID=27848 RepID=A0A183AM86_9TREM|nr:unnamed protein product [Echinostoma caproni]
MANSPASIDYPFRPQVKRFDLDMSSVQYSPQEMFVHISDPETCRGQSSDEFALQMSIPQMLCIIYLIQFLRFFDSCPLPPQVARKRHVGNSSVTFIFQEPDAAPFEPDSIVSRFQQVFIVVRLVQSHEQTPCYR